MLARYALAGLIWSAIGAGIAILFACTTTTTCRRMIPHSVVVAVFIAFCVLLFIPVLRAARRCRWCGEPGSGPGR